MKHAMTSMTMNHCCLGTQQALLAREAKHKIVSMVKWQQPSQLQLHRVSCLVCGLPSDLYLLCLAQHSCITSTDLPQTTFQPLQLATQASHQVVSIIISQDLSCKHSKTK